MKLPVNQILNGHCIEVMQRFPEQSIDMVMFSPPYWGLRDYGEQTHTVWGGNVNCEQEWKEKLKKFHSGTNAGEKQISNRGSFHNNAYAQSGFCVKCGAWRGQLGLEPSWQMYVEHMTMICGELKRVLKKTGSMYIVLGDTYASSGAKGNHKGKEVAYSPPHRAKDYRPKCLMGIPWHVAFALIEDGWTLRNDIIWHKPNHMPSSVKDRLTSSYEHIFHFVKARKYYYDLDAIREPHKKSGDYKNYDGKLKISGRSQVIGMRDQLGKPNHPKGKNPSDFWSINTKPFKGAHFAVYPEAICVKPIKSSCPQSVCRKCGKPRTRMKEKPFYGIVKSKTKATEQTAPAMKHLAERRQYYRSLGFENPPNPRTIGWSDCGCNAGFEAGIVLDPMCGSGTTLVVAKKLGRKWIGIELNPDYVEIALVYMTKTSSPYDIRHAILSVEVVITKVQSGNLIAIMRVMDLI